MAHRSVLEALSRRGVFRGRAAVELGMTRKQLAALVRDGIAIRDLPDTYRMSALALTNEVRLRAALLWAGDDAAAAGRSAGELYGLEGVTAPVPEIVVPRSNRARTPLVLVHRSDQRSALMIRRVRGLRATGAEATIVALAATLDEEALEVACEDARRRGITSVAALRTYMKRCGPRAGVAPLRALLADLDPLQPARSTLEVKTRRLLVAHSLTDFEREFTLDAYQFDFAFPSERVILETNGRRWHDDPVDYEYDNEKWSVPARHGYRLLFATWSKITKSSDKFAEELRAALRSNTTSTCQPSLR